MAKIKLKVQSIVSHRTQADAYALMLAEENGSRCMPVVVGITEAQSVAIALEHIKPPRPLTHDLFHSFAKNFDIQLKEVCIYKFENGVFFAELLFEKDSKSIKIDSRTSDAVALAVRAGCPIYADEKVVDECSITVGMVYPGNNEQNFPNPDDIKDEAQLQQLLASLDEDDLKGFLETAIRKEKYEYAKLCSDELRRRGKEEA